MSFLLTCQIFVVIVLIVIPRTFATKTTTELTQECYESKTCLHDNKEICGKDGKGKPRRFIDDCDIREFNCIYKADFTQVAAKYCKKLKPLPPLSSLG